MQKGNVMASTTWCSLCGGQGFIDEATAGTVGIAIADGRTMTCPVCKGSGDKPPPRRRRGRNCEFPTDPALLIYLLIVAVAVSPLVLNCFRPTTESQCHRLD